MREHTGCESMSMIPMEDDGGGGTAGSHWEIRLFTDEMMNGWGSDRIKTSKMTLALFEDSGW